MAGLRQNLLAQLPEQGETLAGDERSLVFVVLAKAQNHSATAVQQRHRVGVTLSMLAV
jgi:hypothetical protein